MSSNFSMDYSFKHNASKLEFLCIANYKRGKETCNIKLKISTLRVKVWVERSAFLNEKLLT